MIGIFGKGIGRIREIGGGQLLGEFLTNEITADAADDRPNNEAAD
jgi:hypothetical protein